MHFLYANKMSTNFSKKGALTGGLIGAGGGLLVGAAVGGPGGALVGGLAGGAGGALFGVLIGGKKNPNPSYPVTINGVETPEDLYDALYLLQFDADLYNRFEKEDVNPPLVFFPIVGTNYLVRRNRLSQSQFPARGKLLESDTLSLIVEGLPNYNVELKHLEIIPLTILSLELYLENFSDDEFIGVLDEMVSNLEYEESSRQGLYEYFEQKLVTQIVDYIKDHQSGGEISYLSFINAFKSDPVIEELLYRSNNFYRKFLIENEV
jgi:hypothetical protein